LYQEAEVLLNDIISKSEGTGGRQLRVGYALASCNCSKAYCPAEPATSSMAIGSPGAAGVPPLGAEYIESFKPILQFALQLRLVTCYSEFISGKTSITQDEGREGGASSGLPHQ
jgi:hypothetical protein